MAAEVSKARATHGARQVRDEIRRERVSRLRRAANFFYDNLPTGDRLGEFFYATWMLVISVGILNSFYFIRSQEALVTTLVIGVGVNLTWGLIDGISVMYTNIIVRAEADRLAYALRTKKDNPAVRDQALSSFEDSIVGALSPEDQGKVVDMIQAGAPGTDPAQKKYKATRDNRHYAYAILLIELMTTIPILVPFLLIVIAGPTTPIFGNPATFAAVWVSRFVAIAIMIALGAAYARHLNRNPLVAGAVFGALVFGVATAAWYFGW